MKVIQIGGTYVSAQKEIEFAIHEYLQRRGEQSYILFGIGESNESNIIKYETRLESYLRRGLVKFFGKHPIFALPGTMRIIRLLKKYKPDIVHLHIIHHNYIDYPLLFRYLSKIQVPVVFTMHDMWAFTGGCYHYDNIKCDRFLNECRGCIASDSSLDCNHKVTNFKFLQKQSMYHKLKNIYFVSLSNWGRAEIEKTYLRYYPQRTILNGLSMPSINIGKYKRKNKLAKKTIIGVAANWDEKKGYSDFLELAEKLGDDYCVKLVGRISDVIQEHIPTNVICLGEIRCRAELLELYNEADLHISMSKEETFGLTFIEAAIMGTRSAGFNLTAIADILNMINGIVVENISVDGMYIAVCEAFNKNQIECLSDRDVEEIRNIFGSERMATEYYKLYSDIAGGC